MDRWQIRNEPSLANPPHATGDEIGFHGVVHQNKAMNPVSFSSIRSLAGTSVLIAACICMSDSAVAQETSSDWAWKSITKVEGVEFFYIYYSEIREGENGVVIKLTNWNDYAVEYEFTVIFRADGEVHEQEVEGRIGPQTLVTGDDAGLFFQPFEDGRSIGEIGLRGYKVRVAENSDP